MTIAERIKAGQEKMRAGRELRIEGETEIREARAECLHEGVEWANPALNTNFCPHCQSHYQKPGVPVTA
jgi:hypothetical protein